ncbi:helix-turn-helix transcriptional regulator [Paraburkholderia jirisanensis]
MAMRLAVKEYEEEIPVHRHSQGQLVFALHGAVTCQVEDALWMVPPHCGVWIPGGLLHSNRATANAKLYYLFVEPGAVVLPRQCCTLSISPMLREMILHLASVPQNYEIDGHTDRLARVLLQELALMPMERLCLPVSNHPKILQIEHSLRADPGDRSTIRQWARRVAISERSLSRLIVAETGLTFGRWRQLFQLLFAIRELAGGASVQRVSDDLGYESVTAFITMFKKALGQPPARYFASLSRRQDAESLMRK